jgi:transcriptional regulator with XRE-family HTH domain
MSIAQKFESLLDSHRHPDGRKWSGQELHEATGGVVTRSYVSTLRKGKISSPGVEKLVAIAKAMNFPPRLWFEDLEDGAELAGRGDERSIAERLDLLFQTMTSGRTGEPYTNAEVARMSLGDLTEEEVEALRSGRLDNPSVRQVRALGSVFGVSPSYFLGSGEKPALLDEETMRALKDRKSTEILQKSTGLSEGEKDMVMAMIQHLESLHDAGNGA